MLSLEDVVDISGITVFSMAAILIMLMVLNTESRILKSRMGWLVIALAMVLFAIRAYGHFAEEYWFQILRRSIGIVISILYPLGLYLIYLDTREER